MYPARLDPERHSKVINVPDWHDMWAEWHGCDRFLPCTSWRFQRLWLFLKAQQSDLRFKKSASYFIERRHWLVGIRTPKIRFLKVNLQCLQDVMWTQSKPRWQSKLFNAQNDSSVRAFKNSGKSLRRESFQLGFNAAPITNFVRKSSYSAVREN